MKTSQEIINFLKNNIDEKNYTSLFIAGSFPMEAKPGTDLDFFFVIKNSKKNEFFENVVSVASQICKNNPEIDYSFFRGPLKLEYKSLLHFIVYTEKLDNDSSTEKECFTNETRVVLKSLLKSHSLIEGKPLKDLLMNVDLSNVKEQEEYLERKKMHLRKLVDEGYIEYFEWKKIGKSWKYVLSKKFPDLKFKSYLIEYYNKSLRMEK
ncbi:MAG: hypothetical protein Q8Q31_04145 [Nanoarchaeota archaeon]|nr:hypothetical protein [Nanoarchaeota archaeon]